MPRSATPVVSSALALTHLGLLPSAPLTASALATALAVSSYPRVHNYTYFGAQFRGLHPYSPWLRTPVTGFTAGVATVRLARLWTGGSFTHWVTLVNFID